MTTETTNTVQLPVPMPSDKATVDENFWKKLLKVAGKIPFAEDAAAAYFCATDPATPARVKATLYAALAYFVMPFDIVPDFLAAVGFTDDAAVLALALSLMAREIKPEHRAKARAALHLPEMPAA
ncbi:MAG: DUF1232 domain-containing protein [Alphaproteobacteria bacterium]|nr:DUF1232 domain-containing protein [Alphaproteobacteria bacterium]